MDPTIHLISRALRPPRGLAWHGGPTPAGAVRDVSASLARRRPGPGRHTIWELALHSAYWNYAVRRRIEGGRTGRFARSPANWPAMPRVKDEAAWAADKALLREQLELLVLVIERFPAGRLFRATGRGARWSWGDMLVGMAMHDAYHAGQIQLMKRLWRAR